MSMTNQLQPGVDLNDVEFLRDSIQAVAGASVARDALEYIQQYCRNEGVPHLQASVSSPGDAVRIRVGSGLNVRFLCRTYNEVENALNLAWECYFRRLGIELPEQDKLAKGGRYWRDVPDTPEHTELLDAMDAAAQSNPWIQTAVDPPYSRKSVVWLPNPAAAESFFFRENYSVGVAAIYGRLGFINQDVGSEFLAIRADAGDFESCSMGLMIHESVERFWERLSDMQMASVEELRSLKYDGATKRAQATA